MKEAFMEITNEDIYKEIQEIKKDLSCMKSRTKINAWLGCTAMTLVVGIIMKGVIA